MNKTAGLFRAMTASFSDRCGRLLPMQTLMGRRMSSDVFPAHLLGFSKSLNTEDVMRITLSTQKMEKKLWNSMFPNSDIPCSSRLNIVY